MNYEAFAFQSHGWLLHVTRAINLVDKPSLHHQIVSTLAQSDSGYIQQQHHWERAGASGSGPWERFGMARMVLVPFSFSYF